MIEAENADKEFFGRARVKAVFLQNAEETPQPSLNHSLQNYGNLVREPLLMMILR
ncbi:hypothetical protein [Methyloglobulus sp.]|uniref:hypothetical protein n=1 Tax=Methyloglobulus sp. TaxID=2518622 RepID=UPI0032B73AD2